MKRYSCRGALAIFIYCILVLMLTAAVYLLVLVFRGEAILNNSLLGIFISVLISIGLIAAAAVHLVGMFRKAITFSETDLSVKSDFPRGLRIDQYAVRVRYEDIVGLECQRTKPRAPEYVSYALPILLIHCKHGKTRKISLRCFSKGQRKKIIEELILRVEATGKTLPVRSAELLLSKVRTR